jgi:hypothetical protein
MEALIVLWLTSFVGVVWTMLITEETDHATA